jgi:hypothetical protein
MKKNKHREWIENNRERWNEISRRGQAKRRREKPDEVKAYFRAYRKKHRVKLNRYNREWRLKQKEKNEST